MKFRVGTRMLWLVMLVCVALVAGGCSASTSAIETVQPDEAAARIADTPDVVVLDIRTPEELAEGYIEGAINIDFYEPDFAAQIEALDPSTPYVVYCRSGNRSGQAMSVFDDLGFTDVTEIDGGIVNWVQADLPIVRDN